VAGKTFRGVGEDEAPSSRIDEDDDRPRLIDEDDARGLHSGPTVVDDQKVAEVLKKLRSLDKPPGPLTGVTEVVVDANSSEQTRIDSQPIEIDTGPAPKLAGASATEAGSGSASPEDVMYPPKRATAIGRSLNTPVAGQAVTGPPDAVRGTVFGHSIHLPDINAPDGAEVELSSGAVHFLDGSPGESQPFPLADRPKVVVAPPTSVPPARFRTPFDVDLHTQSVDPSGSKRMRRFIAFVGGLSFAGAGVWAWWQYGGHAATSNPPAVAAPVARAPSVDPVARSSAPAPPPPSTPAAATPARAPSPSPAGPAAAEAAAVPPPTAEPDPAPVPAAPARVAGADEPRRRPAKAPSRTHARHAAHASERHGAATPAGRPPLPDEEPAASSNPDHSHKRPAGIEDPDATMAPSE
jgi:hypothetical protein